MVLLVWFNLPSQNRLFYFFKQCCPKFHSVAIPVSDCRGYVLAMAMKGLSILEAG